MCALCNTVLVTTPFENEFDEFTALKSNFEITVSNEVMKKKDENRWMSARQIIVYVIITQWKYDGLETRKQMTTLPHVI